MPVIGCAEPPAIAFSPPSQILSIRNSGSGELSWSVSSSANWLHLYLLLIKIIKVSETSISLRR